MWVEEEQNHSRGLSRQDTGTAAYVYIGIFAGMYDTERPLRTSVSTAADLKFFGSIVGMVAGISGLHLLLPEAEILRKSALSENKSTLGLWKTSFAGKRAALFHLEYVMLHGFADASKLPAEVLNVLERPPSFSVEPL